jgi:cytochrome P450
LTWNEELGAWRITRWEDAVRVLRDPTTFTVDDPRFSTARVVGPSMLSLDGDAHMRHRNHFVRPFRPREVSSRFQQFVAETTRRLIDDIADEDGTELRRSLANPLAIAVIAEALGLDGTDGTMVAQLAEWYRSIVVSVSGVSTGATPSAAGDEAFAALRDVVLDHLHADHPSVLTDAAGHAGGDGAPDAAAGLSDDEVVSNAAVIMFGGIETTEGMILNVVWHLLTNAHVLAAVRADPTLVAAAVEESLRLEPAAAVVDRYATADVIVAGAQVSEGDMVVVSLREANRDPSVFVDPDRFEIERSNVRRHLAFAQGPHVCIGMDLARLEARTAVAELVFRFPALRLDPARPSHGPEGAVFRKPDTLHVVW